MVLIYSKLFFHLDFSDINECKVSNHSCSHACNNTMGSFVCTCPLGYQLIHDDHTCSGNHSKYLLKFMQFLLFDNLELYYRNLPSTIFALDSFSFLSVQDSWWTLCAILFFRHWRMFHVPSWMFTVVQKYFWKLPLCMCIGL